VGLILPDELALGAASGLPRRSISLAPKPRDQRMDRAARLQRQHQRQRAGPEFFRQLSRQRIEFRDLPGHRHRRDMGDQRVEARPALGLEYLRHGRAIGRVAGEPIDGFRRDRDDLAGPEQGQRRLQSLGCLTNFRHFPQSFKHARSLKCRTSLQAGINPGLIRDRRGNAMEHAGAIVLEAFCPCRCDGVRGVGTRRVDHRA
jgi:hypothetical protein